MEKLYLAYGSNLNKPQMEARCPTARVLGTAALEGWRLAFRGRGAGNYLTIQPAPGFSVPVAVWAVTGEDERALDAYEDYPAFYDKVPLPITYQELGTGRALSRDAFVYIMREGFPAGPPTPEYLRACQEGYQAFGFDLGILQEARARSEGGHAGGQEG